MMSKKNLLIITTLALLLAFLVVMLGAYTRLTDAGLGCPDWPGCYGHMVLPSTKVEQGLAQHHFPDVPIESRKAWTEMVHRYAAGTLAILIVWIGVSVTRSSRRGESLPRRIPFALVLLVIFQAALGMWTVTLKLLPVVVMSHLLGGMLIFSALWCLRIELLGRSSVYLPRWLFWTNLGCVLIFCQIALGGWVSSNYAGVACVGFPQCNGQWFPPLHLNQGFNLFSSIGANYQGGVLDNEVRATIQWIHRVGAVLVATYLLFFVSLALFSVKDPSVRKTTLGILGLVVFQFVLGVINVLYMLPLWVAVMHNGIAALLLASFVGLRYRLSGGAPYEK